MQNFYAVWHDGDPGTWPSVTWIGRWDGEGEEVGEECERLMNGSSPVAILDEEQALFLAREILGEVFSPWPEKYWDKYNVPGEDREVFRERALKEKRLIEEQANQRYRDHGLP